MNLKAALSTVAVFWIAAGPLTYGQCMGQYHAKWPAQAIERHVWLVRRTCVLQGAFPITGLPMVLYRGSMGEAGEINNWRWWTFRWA